jgi:hypothetical protein
VGAPDEKNYNAAILLKFVAPIGEDHDMEYLTRQIHHADAAHPWVMHDNRGEPVPSIRWMSSMTMREGDWIDRLYDIEIRPSFMLTQAQIYAYERYGDQLAKTLAEIVPLTILRVDSRIKIEGAFNRGYRPSEMQSASTSQ